MLEVARRLSSAGFDLLATRGTARYLNGEGVSCDSVNKVREGSPHIVDSLRAGAVGLVLNTTSSPESIVDSFSLRRTALETRTPYFTTVAAAEAASIGMLDRADGGLRVRTLQEYHGLPSSGRGR